MRTFLGLGACIGSCFTVCGGVVGDADDGPHAITPSSGAATAQSPIQRFSMSAVTTIGRGSTRRGDGHLPADLRDGASRTVRRNDGAPT